MIDYVDRKELQGIFFEKPVSSVMSVAVLVWRNVLTVTWPDREGSPAGPRRARHDEPRGRVRGRGRGGRENGKRCAKGELLFSSVEQVTLIHVH